MQTKLHTPSPTSLLQAKVRVFFKTLHIETKAMTEGFELLDEIIMVHEEAPFGLAPGACLFAPSHSGKSHFIKDYILSRYVPKLMAENPQFANAAPETVVEEQKVILHVQLSQDATPLSIGQDILVTLGEKPSGQQGTVWYKAHTLMKNLGVKLLVIDEVQHLASTGMRIENGKIASVDLRRTRSSPEALKAIMNRGTVPVVFAGTEIAKTLLPGTQFNGRAAETIRLAPLDWTIAEEKNEFLKFLGHMAIKMKKAGLLDECPPLIVERVPLNIYLSSHGRLGLVCKIVHKAMNFVVRADRRTLTEADLASAVDFFVASGEVKINPFRQERKTTLELA